MAAKMCRVVIPFLLVLSVFAVSAHAQELGDFQQLLGLAYGTQLNNMLSACCVIRNLHCPIARYPPMTSPHNGSESLDVAVRRFEQCACAVSQRCVLSLQPRFLPDGAHDITFNVTFVTSMSAMRYTCTYRSARALICQLRQSMASGIFGWGTGGALSPMGPFGGLGVVGEEMEEVLEQMVESGIPPPRPRNQICALCVPLNCALTVARHLLRMSSYTVVRNWEVTSQQQYHNCLRVNNIRPPEPAPTKPPETVAPVTPSNSDGDSDSDSDVTTAATTRRPTTTSRRPSTPAPPTTTTTPLPSTSPTSQQHVPVMSTPGFALISPTTVIAVDTTTQTINVVVNTTAPLTTTTTGQPMTTSLPEEITRILVGAASGTTSLLPHSNVAGGAATENGTSPPGGGGGVVTGVLLGTLAALAILTALFLFLFFRRRRRQKQKLKGLDGLGGLGGSVGAEALGAPLGKGGLKHKAVSLPNISSKNAVIDAEVRADDDDGGEANNNNDDKADKDKERYTPVPTRPPIPAPPPLATTDVGEDNEVYDSLDETAIIPSRQVVASVASKTTSAGSDANPRSSKARQDSQKYMTMRPAFTLDVTGTKAEVTPTRSGSKKYCNLEESPSSSQISGPVTTAVDGGSTKSAASRTTEPQYEMPTTEAHGRSTHVYTVLRQNSTTSGEVPSAIADSGSQAQKLQNTIYLEPYYILPDPVSRKRSRASKADSAAGESRVRRGSNTSSPGVAPSSTYSSSSRRPDGSRTAKDEVSVSRQNLSKSRAKGESPRTKAGVDAEGYLVPLPPRGPRRL